ncbi:MAG: VOC family protein [Chroococcidiopsidaceae cyanobacterium CP_BM_RX_35]|nr:VOC family protein [Chroococcidiopsidaceae cyanobacterium CP_BM_RX_35]
MNQTLFHLAFPVTNVAQAKAFYVDGLGCIAGRETHHALILNLCGHQLVAHVTKDITPQPGIYPRHFGLIFTSDTDWNSLLARARQQQLSFREEPKHRFPGLPTEHRTFFLEDPFYNLLEFKYYRYAEAIFGSHNYAQIGDSPKGAPTGTRT